MIGAGISGLTCAYLLLRAGKKVIVIDDGPIGSGETGRTTAHLANALDDRYRHIAHWRGEDVAGLAAESHTAAIQIIEDTIAAERIVCDFTRLNGYLFQPDGKHGDKLEKELKATHAAGLTDVELIKRAPWGHFDTGPCLRFPRQAQFHPLKYLHGLARAVRAMGGEIYTGSRVEKVEGDDRLRVNIAGGHTVTADEVVHGTNAPLDAPSQIYLKEFPYRTYVIAAEVPVGSVPPGLYWDTGDPYHYVRVQRTDEGELLIVGGEDHATGKKDDGDERFARLEAWSRERFDGFGEVRYRWSGQVFESLDGLGLIGPYPDRPRQYIITGDSGNGMTHGTLGARLVTDLITGIENPWYKAYDPKRTPHALKEFLDMGVTAASSYARKITAGKSADTIIERGTGEIIDSEDGKLAVFRDAAGKEHELSAECTHRGCIVAWNGTEQTWDCPCHGSRFAANGELLTGPAMTPLKRAKKKVG